MLSSLLCLESVVCAPLLDCGIVVEAEAGLRLVAPVRSLLLPSNPAHKHIRNLKEQWHEIYFCHSIRSRMFELLKQDLEVVYSLFQPFGIGK
jgi:hypothetical protein